jgi:hypothetical protein
MSAIDAIMLRARATAAGRIQSRLSLAESRIRRAHSSPAPSLRCADRDENTIAAMLLEQGDDAEVLARTRDETEAPQLPRAELRPQPFRELVPLCSLPPQSRMRTKTDSLERAKKSGVRIQLRTRK